MQAFVENRASLIATARIEKAEMTAPIDPDDTRPGLIYNYYTGFFRSVNDFSAEIPVKSGTIASFSLEPRDKEQYFGFQFDGYIDIPEQGLYTFYLVSNDGAKLMLDHRVLIDFDGLHPASEKSQTIALPAGKHAVSVQYFQEGGTSFLQVSWKGPGFEKQEIPEGVLFHANYAGAKSFNRAV